MSQLTIPNPGATQVALGAGRRRTVRNNRMVSLRSSLPTGLVTLRHDVPEYLPEFLEETTTPQVDASEKVAETAVGKGGTAQW
ncbi:hypothetical protein LWF15_14245 [Kineosporia rhizophila]|uniref:hypothetical protein n=1 Tax=Kineosporia TaxID=49184 RepID=UPI000B25A7AC|nr:MULTISPECIES: hypothetical protein [Kineosporia]MCE0536665.1 hypothetical protein [Kineosporia rhizophila]GLY13190.1 hypothetical protein Kisp01_02060 [Kineosporia sp. NBRC 101677]